MTRRSKLLEELKMSRPFGSIRQEAALAIMKTADVIRRRAARVLEPEGITTQQYNVLRILRGAGDAGLPTLAIGERLVEETPGMTRLLDRMEHKDWVRRHRCTHDRRQVLCYITRAGIDLLARLDPIVENQTSTAVGDLNDADLETLVIALERIRSSGE